MDKKILIIFKFKLFYEIIKELDKDLNFEILEITEESDLLKRINNLSNYIILSKTNLLNKTNQLIINQYPIKISKLIEKINIEFLKLEFNKKSKIHIGKYKIDLNSRYLISDSKKLKLTEKEANIIIYLFNSELPVKIEKLQQEVWGYNSKLETHTVETHVYRLRKKISKVFDDYNFIMSKKHGYQIN
tara:strand:+ start:9313 stop:9876 length:564 start_codon:yes stop_codon:yes gene_type:complete